ncbi:MAG TPA: alpha/beta hydrolase [Rhizomicrobium sp.]
MTDETSSAASRRALLVGGAAVATAVAASASAAAPKHAAAATHAMMASQGGDNYVTTKDGVRIFYKDWGSGQPIVFSHGWPLSADDWDSQMMFFLQHGYRVIAHDRRGHGRSSQVSDGHDMDHYAADLAAVTEHLDLKHAIHVGHSTGGGEVVHYTARHQDRVAKCVLISAVTPFLLKTDTNPDGIPREGFDPYRQQTAFNRAQFYRDVPEGPFYNFNKPGVKTIPGIVDNWWRQGMMGSVKAHTDGVKAFSETDFRDDMKAITVPVLVMHSKADQVVPYAVSGPKAVALLKNGKLITYEDYPHGMPTTQADVINKDLLAFIQG